MRFDAPDRWVICDSQTKKYEDEHGRRFTSLNQVLMVAGDLPIFVPRWWRPVENMRYITMHTDKRPAHAFKLPVDITTVGPEAIGLLSEFMTHEHAKEERAFVVRHDPDTHDGSLSTDILIASDRIALRLLEKRIDALLVIAFQTDSAEPPPWPDVPTAILWLPHAMTTPQFVDQVLFTIIHDQPLHTVIPTITSPQSPRLFANPWLDHGLRMADAFTAAADAALDAEIASTGRRPFEGAIPDDTPLLNLNFDFVKESRGVLPMARRSAVRGPVFELAVPDARSLENQRRRVDARVERVEYVPQLDRYAEARSSIWVPKDRALRRGGRYRLRIQIGRRADGNLISDDTPDLVLPPSPTDAWTLDVVVFPKDFKLSSPLSSPPRQTLELPKAGASEPLRFDITAPEKGDVAELRFAIYLGNQPLQSFLLTARLAGEEEKVDDGLMVKLELAKSEGFSNLDTLRPRALSLGVNLDADGLHTLCFKLDEAVAEARFPPALLDAPLEAFRNVLEAATVQRNVPVFPADDASLSPQQQAAFENAVRGLAAVGDELHNALFTHFAKEIRDVLRTLMKVSDAPLGFSRYDVNFDMPWAVIYDFSIPEDAEKAAVCRDKDCAHGPGADVYCIKGFWGIRHAIEEHLATGIRRNSTLVIEPAAGAPMLLASDAPDDGFCKAFIDAVNVIRPSAAARITAAQHALDVLWDDQQRPAVMMYLGHFDQQQQIATAGALQFLIANDVVKRAKNADEWAAPNTLILLMACDAMQMTSTTLVNHAKAFAAAGASVIVGPEVTIFPAFACRFAEDVMRSMINDHQTLGRAMSTFRRRVITAGNPLGFAFTAFGEADVAIH